MSNNIGTWPVARHLLPEHSEADSAHMSAAIDAAVGVLWALTGRQFGLFAVEARPCQSVPFGRGIPLAPARPWEPVLDSGVIRNVQALGVGCGRESAVLLPEPVHSLIEFVVDGQPRDLAELHVDGLRAWMREGAWPNQTLSLPSNMKGTFAIRYVKGIEPPAGADIAVAKLAAEFYAAATGGKCQLPRRTQSVQRQGVTVNMVSPEDIYASGATGLTEVDIWIRAHNPHRHAEPAQVWSPDLSSW